MEKKQLSADVKRLIAYRISHGESVSRVAYDFGISESKAARIAVSYYPCS